ncbi:TIM-barrel domain-containing protein [Nocardioides sp. URHA0032]|uniref:TIM-barrel domain-containing protein n=1 Tax=Nocardioides sp. URHA0032 TaxID=1380388 RepID=UPI0012DDF0B2|nr:TIM-barrel domain-containing protein [Nocardioides sp. URHA0032]
MSRTSSAVAVTAVVLALIPLGSATGAPPPRAVDEPIVVDAGGARVVVEQHPFRLSVTDGTGQTVLREVTHPVQDTIPEPLTTDPAATGIDKQDTTTLYAPLSFMVGTETLIQRPSDEWVSNLLSGRREGTWYAAQDVERVEQVGDDVRLTLSTNDPSGRELVVVVGALGDGAVRVRVHAEPDDGVAMLGDSFEATADDGFFGFGGRHDRIDQRGRVLSSFVNQENLAATPSATENPGMYPNGPSAAYYPQAMFWTTRYGFLLPQPELARFKLAVDREDAWNVTASAPHLDYVVAPGAPREAVDTLTALTGRHHLPPPWALGTMLDRLVKNQGETYTDYEARLRDDIVQIDRHHLPLSAYRIEGWGFPGGSNHGLALHTWVHGAPQAAMIRKLRARGIHPLAYIRPWLEPGSAPVEAGYAVRDASGEPYDILGSGGRHFALVDFTNPAAVAWWQQQVRGILDLGFDGFMQDYGEQVMFDMQFADGTTGYTRHNDYFTLYAKATKRELGRYHRDHPDRRPWFFTRAGYTDLPGSARYEYANFPGDETTGWDRASGIASLTTDMLSRAVGGAYGFATDIGGYFDYTTPPTTKELFIRWAEWAALSPIFRLHGSGLSGTHTPWSYDPETVRIYRQMSNLHLQARPLLTRLWKEADRTGAPPTRPLWFSDPDDREGWHQDQEWLLGDDVLVAPVVVEGATSRSVYLPQGCWLLHGRGDRRTGGQSVTVRAGLGALPWFSRCGTDALG